MAKNKKKQLGELEESLVNDIEEYIAEVNKHKPKGNKISRIQLIRTFFIDLLKDKVLTKDHIKLNSPYYFNLERLRKKSEIIATTEIISEPEHLVKIEKIPNNLDSWSIKENTFCQDNNPTKHKGVELVVLSTTNNELEVFYILYLLEGNELRVSLINPEYLGMILKPEDKRILKDLKDIELEFKEDIKKDIPNSLISIKYNSKSNFKLLLYETNVNNIAKDVGKFINKTLKNLQSISEDNELIEELKNIDEEKLSKSDMDNLIAKLEEIIKKYRKISYKTISIVNDWITYVCYFITGLDIDSDTKEEVEFKLNSMIEEYPDLYVIKEIFSHSYNNDEDYIAFWGDNIEKLLNGLNCYIPDNTFNPRDFIISMLDNSEEADVTKKLLNVTFDSENIPEDKRDLEELLKEIGDSFNINFFDNL